MASGVLKDFSDVKLEKINKGCVLGVIRNIAQICVPCNLTFCDFEVDCECTTYGHGECCVA